MYALQGIVDPDERANVIGRPSVLTENNDAFTRVPLAHIPEVVVSETLATLHALNGPN